MLRTSRLRIATIVLLTGCGSSSTPSSPGTTPTTPSTPSTPATPSGLLPNTPPVSSGASTASIVAAANTFLATLDATQRARVLFAATDAAQRVRWSNFPTGIFQRQGVKIGDMTDAQRTALLALLATTLSGPGYTKIINIVNADQVLRNQTTGGNLVFGLAEYFVSFVGTPSTTSPWMLQFGGHHLAVNVPIQGDTVLLTPTLTGNQPGSFTQDGATIRPLGREVDKAFALFSSLTAAQRTQALIGSQVLDLVLGPGQDSRTIAPEGVPGSQLTTAQQAQLIDLITEWVGINNDRNAAIQLARISASIGTTFFAWSGPTASAGQAYFRVTGPGLVLEYAPQQGSADHVHAMFRSPGNDYGALGR